MFAALLPSSVAAPPTPQFQKHTNDAEMISFTLPAYIFTRDVVQGANQHLSASEKVLYPMIKYKVKI
jgi:hypothetical protein